MTRFDSARPRAADAFYKAHGLGNDYLVVEAGDDWTASPEAVARVCHPHLGVGGDGIVVVTAGDAEPFRLRMFNPDGSEFERSGNGLRVAASWLRRAGRVETGRPFEVEVGGDRVVLNVHGVDGGRHDVSVEMGRAAVGADAVGLDPTALATGDGTGLAAGTLALPPVEGSARAGSEEGADAGAVPVNLVGVGNPHCVVLANAVPDALVPAGVDGPFGRAVLDRIGPALATHPAFAAGTNVQLARVPPAAAGAPGGVVEALVWERGVGHTTASGTSACAVAVCAVASGRLAPGPVEVRMEGGSLRVEVTPELALTLRGPVEEVMEGALTPGFLAALARLG